jgi:DNA-binding Lrp family transcriptional regulator
LNTVPHVPPKSKAKPDISAGKDNDSSTFKGVWINAALWNHPSLSWTEKCLVAQVDALTNDKRPCHASSEGLARMMQVSPCTVNNALSRLQTLGIIRRLGFHRVFVERVVAPAYSSNPERNKRWIKPSLTENSNPSLTENSKAEPRVTEFSKRGLLNSVSEGYRIQEPESTREREEKEEGSASTSDEQFINEMKAEHEARGVNVDQELSNMQRWLRSDKGQGRSLTRGFVTEWLGRAEPTLKCRINGHPKNHNPLMKRLDS